MKEVTRNVVGQFSITRRELTHEKKKNARSERDWNRVEIEIAFLL